jgi:thiol-disulfide isomerase/thioredoxin
MSRWRALLTVPVLLLVTGCHSGAGAAASAGQTGPSCLAAPFTSAVPSTPAGQDNPAGVPTSAGAPASAAVAGHTADRVPDLALDCFTGSGRARLTDLHSPTVVTLWASWCEPCKQELPDFQTFADKAEGRIRVVGVVTFDRHDTAQSFIDERKVSFPMLDDPDKRLLTAVGRNALPVTLFLSADGHIAHLYNSQALDEAGIESMATTYLGVKP